MVSLMPSFPKRNIMPSRLAPHPREERSSSLPTFIRPQLSLLVKQPPTGENWAHELKYDGFRFHARLDRGKLTLLTRAGSPLVLSRVK